MSTYATRRVPDKEPDLLGLCFEGENTGPRPGTRGGGGDSLGRPLGLLGVAGFDGESDDTSFAGRGGWICEEVGGVFTGDTLRLPAEGILHGEPEILRPADGRSGVVSGN